MLSCSTTSNASLRPGMSATACDSLCPTFSEQLICGVIMASGIRYNRVMTHRLLQICSSWLDARAWENRSA